MNSLNHSNNTAIVLTLSFILALFQQNLHVSSFTLSSTPLSISSSSSLQSSQLKHSRTTLSSTPSPVEEPSEPSPKTFREAEILGLRLMQESQHKEALDVFQKGLKLPGSKKDIIRTKTLAGPSPVGGSAGGTEGKRIQILDEFELQAAHYNIACACSQLGKYSESVKSLEQAFQAGFDNYATVRSDPDLLDVQGTAEFDMLMEKYDPKKGFPNPFAFFGQN